MDSIVRIIVIGAAVALVAVCIAGGAALVAELVYLAASILAAAALLLPVGLACYAASFLFDK